jgi:hypothetical protein
METIKLGKRSIAIMFDSLVQLIARWVLSVRNTKRGLEWPRITYLRHSKQCWSISIVVAIYIVTWTQLLYSQRREFHYFDGKILDAKMFRNYLEDSIWVDSTAWKWFGYSSGPDTFEVRDGIWYQHFQDKETIFFSKQTFQGKTPTIQYANRDTLKFPRFTHYELVPDEIVDLPKTKQTLYKFHFFSVEGKLRTELCTVYFDPRIGIVRYFALLRYDTRLKYFLIDGKKKKYRW